jgi:hypothetical protein
VEDRALLAADIGIVSAYAPGGDPRPISVKEVARDRAIRTPWSFYRSANWGLQGHANPCVNLFVGK